jgi:preprotein translocase subunit SecY
VFESLLNAFRAPDIRRRILYVLGLLIVFRLLASVPVPGIDRAQLADFVQGNALVGVLDLLLRRLTESLPARRRPRILTRAL